MGGAAHRARRIGPQTPRPDLSSPSRPGRIRPRPAAPGAPPHPRPGTVAAGAAVLRALPRSAGGRGRQRGPGPVGDGAGPRGPWPGLATGGPVRIPRLGGPARPGGRDLPVLDGGASDGVAGRRELAGGRPGLGPLRAAGPHLGARPVVAYNVGVGLGAALLSLAAIALARDRGASPGPAAGRRPCWRPWCWTSGTP